MPIWRVWTLSAVGVLALLALLAWAGGPSVDAQGMPSAPTPGPRTTPTSAATSPPAAATPVLPTAVPTPLPVWLPGPAANGADCACDGFVDAPTSNALARIDQPLVVAGWVADRTAQGWAGFDAVHIYSGPAGQGGTFLTSGTIGKARPDVAATLGNPNALAAGFELSVPANRLPAGQMTLSVYVHSPSRGWWYKQVQLTMLTPRLAQPVLQVSFPPPGEKLKTTTIYSLAGYALDPGAFDGTGVDLVEIYIDGARGEPQAQFVGRAEVGDPTDAARVQFGARFEDTGWVQRFDPSKYKIGNRTLYVYARSDVTANEALVTVDINIVAP